MSIRTTSGRRPSASRRSSASRACSPPSTSPTTSRSGSLPRNASSPCRTTEWSSTISTGFESPSGSIRSGHVDGELEQDLGSASDRARDDQLRADLVGAELHRLEAVVTGLPPTWIEAAAVVADLEEKLVMPHHHANGSVPGVGVAHDVR